MSRFRALNIVLIGLALCVASLPGRAADFPTQVVTIVSPYAPGSPIDTYARVLAPALSKLWNQSVIVDSVSGAGGQLGAEKAARAQPNGYTLLLHSTPMVTMALFNKDMTLEPLRAFKPLAKLGAYPFIIIINPSVPAKTLPEFVAYVKEHPGTMNYSIIPNSGHALDNELFQQKTGMKMVGIPYQTGPQIQLAITRNDVQMHFSTTGLATALVADGKVRAIATTSRQRFWRYPELPTVSEALGIDFSAESFLILFAPRATPADISAKIAADTIKVMQEPATAAMVKQMDYEATSVTPEQMSRELDAVAAAYAEVSRVVNARPK